MRPRARRPRGASWLLALALVAGAGCAKQPSAAGPGTGAPPPSGGLHAGEVRVTWFGQSYYLFEDAAGHRVAIDPFGDIGLSRPAVEADVVLVTHEHFDHNNVAGVGGSPIVVHGLGADERFGPRLGADQPMASGTTKQAVVLGDILKDGAITVIPGYHDDRRGADRGEDAFFRWTMGGIAICHLGDIGQTALSADQLKAIGTVDVLFIPVGGKFTVNAEQAAALMAQVKPRLTVPMHYRIPHLSVEIDGVDAFLLGRQFWTAPSNSIVLKKDAERGVTVVGESAPPASVPVLVFSSPPN